MTVEGWLQAACADAERRGLPEMKALLENLARSMAALRAADWNATVGTRLGVLPERRDR